MAFACQCKPARIDLPGIWRRKALPGTGFFVRATWRELEVPLRPVVAAQSINLPGPWSATDRHSIADPHGPPDSGVAMKLMRSRSARVRTTPAAATGAQALGTVALGSMVMGAIAVGALAIGALSIGRVFAGRVRIRRLAIDELVVLRVRVTGEFTAPPSSPEGPSQLP